MEGWARILWGLGPLFGGDNTALPAEQQAEITEWVDLYRTGLIHGTDPSHPEYWGDIFDYDQKMVETAALDLALCLAPDMLWTPLTDAQKQNVYRWLNQMNAHRIHPNNWRFFRILTNMTFARLGLPYDTDQLKDDFGVVEHCYTGGGWYFDGNPGQMDYYIPCHALLLTHLVGALPAGCRWLRDQAQDPQRRICRGFHPVVFR